LKRRGRYGLLFIDGHADFYQPEVNPNGEAASMDLAFATGHGRPKPPPVPEEGCTASPPAPYEVSDSTFV
jgi:arginase